MHASDVYVDMYSVPFGHNRHRQDQSLTKMASDYNIKIFFAQVPGKVFVHGTGDCGQLGLGEDITERKRPFPLSFDGKKVGSFNAPVPKPYRRLPASLQMDAFQVP